MQLFGSVNNSKQCEHKNEVLIRSSENLILHLSLFLPVWLITWL